MRTSLFPALIALFISVLAGGCSDQRPPADHETSTQHTLQITAWPLPADAVAAQPDLVHAPDGNLLLSWISPQQDGHQLRYARYRQGQWQAPQTIAQGNDWFVNWADTPHLLATADGALWAQWLRKSANTPYAYDVLLARSADGGQWSEPITVHDDGTATEHGFVSLWADGHDRIGIAWLDGRHTGTASDHDAHADHAGSGAMSLRSTRIDAQLHKHEDVEIDAMTCDCCPTAVATSREGPMLVYRGRSSDEIRDIRFTAYRNGQWSAPRDVHEDGWRMPACPVNGPSMATNGNDVWVGWYTAPDAVPQLRLSYSTNAGETFAVPRVVDSGDAVQGRVQLAADAQGVWVAWIREDHRSQSLWLSRYGDELHPKVAATLVATLSGRGRGTGFPQLVAHAGNAYLAWTDVIDGKPVLRGAIVTAAP